MPSSRESVQLAKHGEERGAESEPEEVLIEMLLVAGRRLNGSSLKAHPRASSIIS